MPLLLMCFLVIASGMAALSWEVIWQIKLSLALGVSSWGTAITLAVTMGGMCSGALLMGHLLKEKEIKRPIQIYGILECIIGLSGIFLLFAFNWVETLDTNIYTIAPHLSGISYISSIITILGIPAICMGATIPVLGLIARLYDISIALLYGLNTFGAAIGVLLAAFVFIPTLGIQNTICLIATINISVGFIIFLLKNDTLTSFPTRKTFAPEMSTSRLKMGASLILVFVTGFATFMLEIAWFRSLTATFISTTDAFAIMLASVLLALGIAAWLIPILKNKKFLAQGCIMVWAGALILFATPVVERLDLIVPVRYYSPTLLFGLWFIVTFVTIGLPILLLGTILPAILDEQKSTRNWAYLYAFNAFAAILGAILAAWVFLPNIGFARTAWLTGGIVLLTGLIYAPARQRILLTAVGIAALYTAVSFESGIGRTRIQGITHVPQSMVYEQPPKILAAYEGPDVTASAIEYSDGGRALFIDGFVATQQPTTGYMVKHINYMASMGHIPMIMHPKPNNALVICFGTGQTANAVRKENPQSLDIVDINKNVFKLAPYFPSNDNVLDDPRVNKIISDGRAYLRRTQKIYDVITMEPMPPTFAGVNALYSREFYQIARKKLGKDGMIAQWLPFHHSSTEYNASIAKTFQSVFPNSILWIDPLSNIGILVGSANDKTDIGNSWPGMVYKDVSRNLSDKQISEAMILYPNELTEFGKRGNIITDDNQLLAYGQAAHSIRFINKNYHAESHELLKSIKNK